MRPDDYGVFRSSAAPGRRHNCSHHAFGSPKLVDSTLNDVGTFSKFKPSPRKMQATLPGACALTQLSGLTGDIRRQPEHVDTVILVRDVDVAARVDDHVLGLRHQL